MINEQLNEMSQNINKQGLLYLTCNMVFLYPKYSQ